MFNQLVTKWRDLNIQAGIKICLVTVMLVLALLSLTAWIETPVWWLNLACHFVPQYLSLQFLLLLAFLLWRGPGWIASVLVLMMTSLPNFYLEKSYDYSFKGINSDLEIKLLHLNVYAPNRRYQDIAKLIRERDPDVVDLVEYTEASRRGLEATGVFKKYPYRFTGKAHLGLYSRFPLSETRLVYVAPEQVANNAQLHTRVKVEKNEYLAESLTLIVAHPPLPVGGHAARQQQHFQTWSQQRRSFGQNLIIVGDLNTTPWSPLFRKLLSDVSLTDSMQGYGVQPTWPVWSAIKIPIDHVLHSSRLNCKERLVGPDVGSDHLPVFVKLAFPMSG